MKAEEYIYQRFKDEHEFKLIPDLYKIMEDFAEQKAIEFIRYYDSIETDGIMDESGYYVNLYNKFKQK